MSKIIKRIFIFYALYLLVTGVFIFLIPKQVSEEYMEKSSVSKFYSNDIGPDRGILIDNPTDSGMARLKIIDSAKERLDVSYFSIETGESPNLFFGALIEAADRGVEVNLLLDGLFHGLRGELKPIIYTFISHPNMNLKLYEPFHPLKPWTLNNRMHDKYIIADDKIAIIGGRNIGDKYFAPDWFDKSISNDRDIVLINFDSNHPTSVLNDMSTYFHTIWNHPYSKPVNKNISNRKYIKGVTNAKKLKEKAQQVKKSNPQLFAREIDLMNISFPTNKVTFIHNPIERFSKEPWCWYEITQLMKSAQTSIFAQSPYVILNKSLVNGFFDQDDFTNVDISILTNSLKSTPNVLAFSGYLNYREDLVASGINVFEFKSTDSIHAKSFIIDSNLVAVGSFNLDPRSAYLSTESMVVIHSSEAVEKLEEGLTGYLDRSLLVSESDSYFSRKNVEEMTVGLTKKYMVRLLSFVTRWIEYLL